MHRFRKYSDQATFQLSILIFQKRKISFSSLTNGNKNLDDMRNVWCIDLSSLLSLMMTPALYIFFVSNSDNWVDTYSWLVVFEIKHESLCLSRLTKYNYMWTIMDIKRIWVINQNRKSIFLAWLKYLSSTCSYTFFFLSSIVNRHAMSTMNTDIVWLMDCK